MWFGKQLGKLLYMFSSKRRKVAEINLRHCFPEMNDADREEVIKKHFLSVGMSVISTGVSWWKSDDSIRHLGKIEGMEHLENAAKAGRGVILLSAHFNNLEVGLRLLKTQTSHPLYAVYQANSNPLLDAITYEGRARNAEDLISHKDIKKMIRYLKQGKIIWYAPDQGYMGKYGEMVPFFGIPAASNTATSRLAKFNNSAVVPFFVRQTKDGQGYDLTLLPALDNFPSGDDIKDTERYHLLIEEEARKAPEQYLWIHRRFKKRPAEYPDLYKDIVLRK